MAEIGLSDRVSCLKPSAIAVIGSLARSMKEQGEDVIDFGLGEPDFDTPEYIKESGISAIRDNFTRYTDPSGTIPLKDAIITKLYRDNNLNYEKNQVIVSNGAKHTLNNIMQVLLNPGHEVILPKPYWVSYISQIELAGAKAVICDTDGFKVRADLIEERLTDQTKLIILNSPCNPTGAVIEKNELEKIAELAVKRKIPVVSDEIYEPFVYDNQKPVSIASLNDGIKELALIVNGVSKAYAMTGWRIGYCAGPSKVIRAMSSLQSQETSNPCSVSQKAAIAALNGSQQSVNIMRKEFDDRRNLIVKRLDEIDNISYIKPEGAFYVFPDISRTGLTSKDFAEKLLKHEKVVVVPGIEFGEDSCIRISYACPLNKIEEGMNRIERFCNSLR